MSCYKRICLYPIYGFYLMLKWEVIAMYTGYLRFFAFIMCMFVLAALKRVTLQSYTPHDHAT